MWKAEDGKEPFLPVPLCTWNEIEYSVNSSPHLKALV